MLAAASTHRPVTANERGPGPQEAIHTETAGPLLSSPLPSRSPRFKGQPAAKNPPLDPPNRSTGPSHALAPTHLPAKPFSLLSSFFQLPFYCDPNRSSDIFERCQVIVWRNRIIVDRREVARSRVTRRAVNSRVGRVEERFVTPWKSYFSRLPRYRGPVVAPLHDNGLS